MKRILGIIVVAAAAVVAYWSFSSSESGTPTPDSTAASFEPVMASELPNLLLTTTDGKQVNVNTLKGKIILVLFQPDCDHCQREAQEFRENLDSFRKYTLYFITSNPMPEIAQFATDYQLAGKPGVVFAYTEVMNVINTFGQVRTPSIYVYGPRGELIKSFNGETPVTTVAAVLK
ncbi:MAG: peroxiredoxin family protein [Bacteroidia bacterium]|nr:peroxiredoxin family protein [Bacteroidia bacterium]